MKPVSDIAFSNICLAFSIDCEEFCSQATYIVLEEIGLICDPNGGHDKNEFIFNKPFGTSDKKSFIEGIVEEIYKKVIESKSIYDDFLYDFLLTNTSIRFEGDDPESEIEYTDFDSFIKDIDLEFLKSNLKRCWERACNTEEPFPSGELFQILSADSFGLDDFS
tara:strand:- start:432 stop:923 length:492 start_codon:yes stop_codon:yes gene_type:complete